MIDRRYLLLGATASGCIAASRLSAAPLTVGVSLLDLLPEGERDAVRAGRSTFDCGPALGSALSAGGTVYLPAGRYVVATPVVFTPRIQGRFSTGCRLIGDGPGQSVLEDRTAGRALLDFDSGANPAKGFLAIRDVHLAGFSIEGRHAAASAAAIRLRGCYQSSIANVHIIDRPGSGIIIPCLYGDTDGSNMILLDQVRIENCMGWGIEAAAMPGSNEISFLHLRQVFIQNCGTPGGATPTSGGMRYKGQMLLMEQCAFTLNQNVGLFIPGEAGLAINATISSVDFENNLGRHFLCTGISVFRATDLQFFSNDSYQVTVACEFSGASHMVRAITIDGVTMRATAGNSRYIGFRFSGPNVLADTCLVRNVIWENFGYPGQTRFAGSVGADRP